MNNLFRTLHGRLLLVLLGLVVPLGFFFVSVVLRTSQQYYQEITQKLNAGLAESLVADRPDLMIGNTVDTAKFDLLARVLAVNNPGVEVYILSDQGEIIGSSVVMEELERKKINMAAIDNFLVEDRMYPVLGTDPRRSSGQKIFSVAPLAHDAGYLYVILADQTRDSVIRTVQNSIVLRTGLWGGGVTSLIILLTGVLAFTLLTRRLRQLAVAMLEFKDKDFMVDKPLLPKKVERDELDQLQNVFGEMAQRISEQVKALRNVDTLRRELISNVSHDLRTPLAALRGYLETMQLKDLSPEENKKYLQAASKHSERLGRLIGDLFELSTLDADAVEAHVETFPLQELTQDIILKFEDFAKDKGINLTMTAGDLPFVLADIGLIERAITNLIDNAIRYTPQGGEVKLELYQDYTHIRVAVSDTGCGIPKEDLPHIFDRFFRVGNNQHTDGSGLGLAITKRIVALHDQEITVQSSPQRGTTFSFDLQIAT